MVKPDIKRTIIDNTKLLIRKQGAITIKDIAEATKINIAAVNYHFGSKDKLIQIVISEILDELKTQISKKVVNLNQTELEPFMYEIFDLVYTFTFENAGILKYLFLSVDGQDTSALEIVNSFFMENEFTKLIYESLNSVIKAKSQKDLIARYMILFSSCIMPMIVYLVQGSSDAEPTFKDAEFKKIYINLMMQFLK